MADDLTLPLSNNLIDGRFAVDTSQILLDAGGGLQAYLARDRLVSDRRRVALAVSRDASPRLRALKILTDPVDNLMVPLGHGIAPLPGGKTDGYFVICTPPPGPPLSASLAAWPEKILADLVLRPVARVLEALQNRKLTHRAIRLNNVFQAAPGQPVTLGAGWAAPAAMHQPVVFESPYNAICHPAGRGDGLIADDVYALGVLLLTLLTGSIPMANMDDATIIRWKIEQGSFAALTHDISINGQFAELLRSMLADDPDHRPLPDQLSDPSILRGRRVVARAARRSQQALMLSDIAVFDARMLALALLSDQKKASQFLRNGMITQWLRRGLTDASLAAQIEELLRERLADTAAGTRGDALLVMRTISTINPRMPLCWNGIALWPDALPALLAQALVVQGELLIAVEDLLTSDIVAIWSRGEARQGRPEVPDFSAHRSQIPGPTALLRLFYGLNPMLPCRLSTMMAAWITQMPELMRFLEQNADAAGDSLIDPHLSAFIAARADRKIEMQVGTLATTRKTGTVRLNEMLLLKDLQARYHPAPLPKLAKWVAARLRPELERWRNKPRREALNARLDALAQAGFLSRLIDLIEDAGSRLQDAAGAAQAELELATIDAEVAAIDNDDRLRLADAERFGQAIAGGIGLSILILISMTMLL